MTGSCGACEVEITKTDAVTGETSTGVVRACVAAFPRGYTEVLVSDFDDMVWN